MAKATLKPTTRAYLKLKRVQRAAGQEIPRSDTKSRKQVAEQLKSFHKRYPKHKSDSLKGAPKRLRREQYAWKRGRSYGSPHYRAIIASKGQSHLLPALKK